MADATITAGQEQRQQIHNGATVLGPKGDRIGWVYSQSKSLTRVADRYLVVEKKFLFYRTGVLYIPMSAVEGVKDGDVILNRSHAEGTERGWETSPRAA